MKDSIIYNKSVSQFCEKIIYFQITRGFDGIFKQGLAPRAESHTKLYKIKRKIIFSQNWDTLLLEINQSSISNRFHGAILSSRKVGAHFM